MSLLLNYPWYFSLFCLLLGGIYALALYGRQGKSSRKGDDMQSSSPLPKGWRVGLACVRALSVSVIAFLLLSPMVKTTTKETEKPIIIWAQDCSTSIVSTKDSNYFRTAFADETVNSIRSLQHEYDVHTLSFGSSITAVDDTFCYNDQATDFSQLFDYIADNYSERNVGGVVLLSDGLYNRGSNPVTAATKLNMPIFTVALGDTTSLNDASIVDVRCNNKVFLNNQFPLEITIRANGLSGKRATLKVLQADNLLYTKDIYYESENYSAAVPIMLSANKAGIVKYTIDLSVATDEINRTNNVRTAVVEVVDNRQKVAIIASVPHPDIAALKSSLATNEQFEVSSFLVDNFKEDINTFDLLILHQIPSRKQPGNTIANRILSSKVPKVFIIGSESDFTRFNTIKAGEEVSVRLNERDEVTPIVNKAFSPFTLNDNSVHSLEQFPPLTMPFGDYKLASNANVLMTARKGTIDSKQPLIAVLQNRDSRVAIINGEGLWRWRLADYQINQSHLVFDELLSKLVTYTALRQDEERFNVEMLRLWQEFEPVEVSAHLLNDNYEYINTPDAMLELWDIDAQADRKSFHFNRSGQSYALKLTGLKPAEYHYNATVTYAGNTYAKQGMFVVGRHELEQSNLVADHTLMNTLAVSTGGKMLMPDNLSSIKELLGENGDITSTIYERSRYADLLHLPWLMVAIFVLLTIEWCVRKWNGVL